MAYPKRTDLVHSGDNWVSYVPSSWELKRADFVVGTHRVQLAPDLFEDQDVYHYSIPVVQQTSVGAIEPGGDIDSNKTWIKDDQVLVSKLNPRKGTVCIASPHADLLTIASSEFIPVCPIDSDIRYLFYLWKCEKVKDRLSSYVQSVTKSHQRCSPDEVLKLPWAWPSIVEQQEISTFLDKKTAEIGALIEKKEEMLELLSEKRSAIITKSVTKGINPNVPMKRSGTDWLGNIPVSWEALRLRFVGRAQNGINIGGEFFGKGYPFVSYSDVFNNSELPRSVAGLVESSEDDRKRYSVKQGDIFFTRTSETIEEIAFSSVCMETIEDATFAGFLIRVRPMGDAIIPEFAKYYFRNSKLRAFFVKEMNLVTRASLSQTLLGNVPVLVPPIGEQREIADYLDQQMNLLSETEEKLKQAIELLIEYRSALITSAVTGQIEVTE